MKDKILYLVIEISQMLKNNNCTYSEAEDILKILTDEFNQQREDLEYATYDDYFKGNKTSLVDHNIIQALNHVDGFY